MIEQSSQPTAGHELMSGILDVAEIAERLKVHPETIRQMARLKKIPARKVGKEWRFSISAVMKWLDQSDEQDKHEGAISWESSKTKKPASGKSTSPYRADHASSVLASRRTENRRKNSTTKSQQTSGGKRS